MAIGTITVAEKTAAEGPVRHDLISFLGDGSYPTGGTAAFQAKVRAALGGMNVEVVAVYPQDCGGYMPCYDKTNDKLKVFYVDNNNASDGPQIEVPNTTNLSGVTFNVVVLSK